MKILVLLFLSAPVLLFGQQADVTQNKKITSIAFGSCSKQDNPESQLWKEINATNPDLWIWLGDNIYGDTEDMQVMREKYDLQKSHVGYQKLLTKTEVIGIWDDHDFGVNDGGSEYPMKDESKEELFRFLDVPQDHPARDRKGAYQSYVYSSNEGSIKIILLDARYFRDSLRWNNPGTPRKEAIVNSTGDVLGDEQWQWLAEQLSEETIDLFIIGSGIQVLAEEHRWEKWANFPTACKRLLDLISDRVTVPLVFISGDRHLSEVSKMEISGHPFPIWDLTSSSLNSPSGISKEANKYRVGKKINEANFAIMQIEWNERNPTLKLLYEGADGREFSRHTIDFK